MAKKLFKWFWYVVFGTIAFCITFYIFAIVVGLIQGKSMDEINKQFDSDSNKQQVEENVATTDSSNSDEIKLKDTNVDLEQAYNEAKTETAARSQESAVKTYGFRTIQQYGDTVFPYGWNFQETHLEACEQRSDGSWFVKAGCTFKNEYGTKVHATCEATLVGSEENWTVTGFNVY